MSIVREHIYEKFVEDSDPITDMGIGMKHQIKKWIETETGYKYKEKDLLWICAGEGKIEFVKYLLDTEADVHADNDHALRSASYNGHTDVVKLLLDAGANVHAAGYQALQWAINYKHDDVVKILQDHIAKEKKNKAVKESLNEKFTEDSDPIKDLEIGLPKNIIINKLKKILDINRKESEEFIIRELEIYSLACIITTNNPNWPVTKIINYLNNIFKQVRLGDYFTHNIVYHKEYTNYHKMVYTLLLKKEYQDIFDLAGLILYK